MKLRRRLVFFLICAYVCILIIGLTYMRNAEQEKFNVVNMKGSLITNQNSLDIRNTSLILPTLYVPPQIKMLKVWVDHENWPYSSSASTTCSNYCDWNVSDKDSADVIFTHASKERENNFNGKQVVTFDLSIFETSYTKKGKKDLHMSWRLSSDLLISFVPPLNMYMYADIQNKRNKSIAAFYVPKMFCPLLKELVDKGIATAYGACGLSDERTITSSIKLNAGQTVFIKERYGGGGDKHLQEKMNYYTRLINLYASHAFVFIFEPEGASHQDFVTDNVFWALSAGTVPIYCGAPNIKFFVPFNSIIQLPYRLHNINDIILGIIIDYENVYFAKQKWRMNEMESVNFDVDHRPAVTSASNIETVPCRVCSALQFPNNRLGLVVSIRQRQKQIPLFSHYMHNWLGAQAILHDIYFIEQSSKGLFNRAKLFNVGLQEVINKGFNNDVCFHDIDYLPNNKQDAYGFKFGVRQPIYQISCRKPPSFSCGGVFCAHVSTLQEVNGWPNKYWGWGQEDHNMQNRFKRMKLEIYSPKHSDQNGLYDCQGQKFEQKAMEQTERKRKKTLQMASYAYVVYNQYSLSILDDNSPLPFKDGLSSLKYSIIEESYSDTWGYFHLIAEITEGVPAIVIESYDLKPELYDILEPYLYNNNLP